MEIEGPSLTGKSSLKVEDCDISSVMSSIKIARVIGMNTILDKSLIKQIKD